MSNPCDLVFTRRPKAPDLKAGGELFIETRPVAGTPVPPVSPPLARPPIPGASDTVMPMANPLAAAAGNLDHMRGEPEVATELERTLPAMAQRVLDLISRNGEVLDSALSAMAGTSRPEDLFQPAGGRLGRVAAGDALERAEPSRRPSSPAGELLDVQPLLDLAAPVAPLPVEPERLAELAPPPAPDLLKETLEAAQSTPMAPQEAERCCLEAPPVTHGQVQVALRHLPELEAFVGGALRIVADRCFESARVSRRMDPSRLLGSGELAQAGPVGGHLVALRDLYQVYKADYYGLVWARRALLDRRDPAALVPLLSEEEIEDYLWSKYGSALRSRLWRLVRASLPHRPGVRRPLGSDRPWSSGGKEPGVDLLLPGLFVALRSEEGDLEIQKEQGNPWSSRGLFNLAVAVRLGGDVVAYDVRSGVLRINHRVVPWSHGVYELPEGARLELGDDRLHLVSVRGDALDLAIVGRSLELKGWVSGVRLEESVSGALGTFGAAEPSREGHEGLAASFLESWRVLPEHSLDRSPSRAPSRGLGGG